MPTPFRRAAALLATATAAAVIASCAPAPVDAPPATVPPATAPEPTAPRPGSYRAGSVTANIGGCDVFGPDHFLNATGVGRLPVHPKSAQWTKFLAADGARLGVPSPDVWEGSLGGMAFNVVDSTKTGMSGVYLNPHYVDLSIQHTGGYPIPPNPRIEGYPSAQWDRHLLMVDTADCTAYELIQYDPLLGAFGIHRALAGARYPLSGTTPPPMTTNAAATPMIGAIATIDEVAAGKLGHAISFCSDELSSARALWPARATDGKSSDPGAPPMGAWLRLKATVDTTRFTGQARTIATGLARHGMILTDTCGHRFAMSGEASTGWNRAEMAQLRTLTANDFEAVDTTPMMVSPTSWQIR